MQSSPEQEGFQATFWTVAMVVSALAMKVKGQFSLSAIRRVLHQIDLRWGRPRLTMPDKVDPQKAQKQWELVKAVVEAPTEAAILYGNEPIGHQRYQSSARPYYAHV